MKVITMQTESAVSFWDPKKMQANVLKTSLAVKEKKECLASASEKAVC